LSLLEDVRMARDQASSHVVFKLNNNDNNRYILLQGSQQIAVNGGASQRILIKFDI